MRARAVGRVRVCWGFDRNVIRQIIEDAPKRLHVSTYLIDKLCTADARSPMCVNVFAEHKLNRQCNRF